MSVELNTPTGQRATETARALVTAYVVDGDGARANSILREAVGDIANSDPEFPVLLVKALSEFASVAIRAATPDDTDPSRTIDIVVRSLLEGQGLPAS